MATQPSIPTVQSAWRVVRRGSPAKALSFDHDVPVPSELSDGEVLVKVEAAALNPVGYKLMGVAPNFLVRRPYQAAEHDLAGTVVLSASPKLPVGTRVFGFIPVPLQVRTGQGALTQYTRVLASYLTCTPDNVSSVEAAGVALAGQAAYQALIHEGRLQPGQTVFINGGSGSVGAYAIMIAKALGCTVWASASAPNEAFVRGLGADHFIDYRKAPLHQSLSAAPPSSKFHLLFDAVGLKNPSLYIHSPAYLAPSGRFVAADANFLPSSAEDWRLLLWKLGTTCWPGWLGGVPRSWKAVMLNHREDDMEELRKMLAEGRLTPVVDSVFAFKGTLLAYDRIMTGRARGKVVVRIEPEEGSGTSVR